MAELSESIDVVGKWWLPEAPDRKISGRLTFDPEKGGELTLGGVLRTMLETAEPIKDKEGNVVGGAVTADSLEKAGTYDRIVGEADESAFTLEDCFQIRRTGMLLGEQGGTQTLFVNQILQGASFEPGEAISGHQLIAHLDHFKYWPLRTGIVEEQIFRDSDSASSSDPFVTLHMQRVEPLTFKDDDGTEFGIHQEFRVTGDRVASRSLTQNFVLTIGVTEAQPIEDLLRQLRVVQDFASIGLNRSASTRHIVLKHPDCFRTYGKENERKDFVPIQFRARFVDYSGPPPERPLRDHDMLFSLDAAGGMEGVERWTATGTEYGSIVNRVVSAKYSRTMFVSDRLLNIAAALEAFDRTRTGTKGSKFRTRMMRNCDLAGDLFTDLVQDHGAWVLALKTQRNSVAHHLELPTVEITTQQQHLMSESAYMLFAICMLRTAGIQEEVFETIRGSQVYINLKRRLRNLDLSKST